MSTIAIHGFISGRVQGVFYRDSTQQQATHLGITGWVKNCSDGRVELFACGTPEAIEQLTRWCWQGPANADVTDVQVNTVPLQTFAAFEVRY